ATSFPEPITLGSAFDDSLIKAVGDVISTEARAFNNFGMAGLDFFTPNINLFRDPRWGRGQETPGEDPFHISQYVLNLVDGLQGGIDPTPYFKIVADCKHYAAYDIENWEGNDRTSFNAVVTNQDLSEYYLPSFQSCVRDAKVGSIMCSYNSVNGIPSCANSYLLQTILRDFWGFNDDRWVTSDCDAVDNIFSTHHFTSTYAQAVADALKAGTDIDCGNTYAEHLPEALNQSLITRADLEKALIRQYTSLVRLGYFDPPDVQPYRQLDWSDVNSPNAQQLAYQAAVEGIVLLKNDGTLPLDTSIKKLALIGPFANATTQMQGNYQGIAPFLISPLQGAMNAGYQATFVAGTTISDTSTAGFAAAVAAAQSADAVIFAGGIDGTVENEGQDRTTIVWPGVQLDLIAALEAVGKPLVVLQFGGGQVDDSALKNNQTSSILMDHIVELSNSKGFNAILVVVCCLAKQALFIPYYTTDNAPEFAKLFLKHVFSKYGLPDNIVSNCSPLFVSHFWQLLCKVLEIKINLSATYHPEIDRQTEQVKQMLEQYLCFYINYLQNN
ncbi:putative exo-1,4-beta-xylosidase bxlB, partial [Termitomyces sp. J132]